MPHILVNDSNEIVTWPYSIWDLRQDNISEAFPAEPTAEELAVWNVYEVTILPSSLIASEDYDPRTHKEVQDEEPVLIDGEWVIRWNLVELTAEEQTQVNNNAISRGEATIAAQLADSEWTQAADSGLTETEKAAWDSYRDALNNLTSHADWPWVTWTEWPSPPTS